MHLLAGIAGVVLIVSIMWDAFEVIVLHRRVTRRLRPARLFYRLTWRLWSGVARQMRPGNRRETYLSFYGPLSLLLLLNLWAASMVVGFGLLQWAIGPDLHVARGVPTLGDALYMSGSTFFTLGLGDITPYSVLAKALTVVEAGTGFLFLAVIVGYLPVIYQAFSRREVNISLLDARAGSPPSAAELLHRHGEDLEELHDLLRNWERWSAELLESHLSYPVLSYFRSQHDNQSWLAALATILDSSALVIAGIEGTCARQAQLTFAIARHAVVDLAQVFQTPPRPPQPDRLPSAALKKLRASLAAAGIVLKDGEDADRRLAELRRMYEPYVQALADRLLFTLPAWNVATAGSDNWRTSAWERYSSDTPAQPLLDVHDDEF